MTEEKTSAETWFEKYFAERRDDEARLKAAYQEKLAAICRALEKEKVEKVAVTYDGSGDSGQVEQITYYDPDDSELEEPEGKLEILRAKSTLSDGKWVETVVLEEVSLSEAIENIAYGFLEIHSPGWEYNEGAYGDLEILVKERKATLTHNYRFTDTRESSMTLKAKEVSDEPSN